MKGSGFLFTTFIYNFPQDYWLQRNLDLFYYILFLWSACLILANPTLFYLDFQYDASIPGGVESLFFKINLVLLVPSNLLINFRNCLLVFTQAMTTTSKQTPCWNFNWGLYWVDVCLGKIDICTTLSFLINENFAFLHLFRILVYLRTILYLSIKKPCTSFIRFINIYLRFLMLLKTKSKISFSNCLLLIYRNKLIFILIDSQ